MKYSLILLRVCDAIENSQVCLASVRFVEASPRVIHQCNGPVLLLLFTCGRGRYLGITFCF
jgi:hypothetical protein